MENQFFSYDGKNLYSKVTGKKVATAQMYYYNDLGIEESIKFCSQGALVKKKIGLLVELDFINNDGTKLFGVSSKKFHKYRVYDINAFILKTGILLSYSSEKDFFYEYRTFDGKIKSALTMADLVDKINEIDGVKIEKNISKQKKNEPVYTKFLMSCIGQDFDDNEEDNLEEN